MALPVHPRIPVSRPHLGALESAAIKDVIESGQITHGPRVLEFEQKFREYLGVPYSAMCSSGTTALHLALRALDIGPGDEVIIPNITFVATGNAVLYCGATPVLVDVDPDDWNLDLNLVEHAITERTKAIIAVHLYGVPVDMEKLNAIAQLHNLYVVEDAAEGLGGYSYEGKPLGTLSDIGVFSFYGNKVITSGEGGAIVTKRAHLIDKVRHLRGQAMVAGKRFFHDDVGYNYRMTDLQAAIGLAQLSQIEEFLREREGVFVTYWNELGEHCYSPAFRRRPDCTAPWLFTVDFYWEHRRDAIADALYREGIETRPVFAPLHTMPMFHGSAHYQSTPYARSLSIHKSALSLPTYASLSADDVLEICSIVRSNW